MPQYTYCLYDQGDVPKFALILELADSASGRYRVFCRMSEQQYTSGAVASLVATLNGSED